MREDYGTHTEDDAGRYERRRARDDDLRDVLDGPDPSDALDDDK